MVRQAGTPEAGVYRIVNSATGRMLLGSSENLKGVRNRLEFAVATESVAALDGRLVADARQHGIDTFEFEVLDVLDRPEDSESLADDLDGLLGLWQERLSDQPSY
jgi:hypothetical protein